MDRQHWPELAAQYAGCSPSDVAERFIKEEARLKPTTILSDPTDKIHQSKLLVFMEYGTKGKHAKRFFVKERVRRRRLSPITYHDVKDLPYKYRSFFWHKRTVGKATLGVMRVLPKSCKRILKHIRRTHVTVLEQRKRALDSFTDFVLGPAPPNIVSALAEDVISAKRALELQLHSFFDKRQRTLMQTGIVVNNP